MELCLTSHLAFLFIPWDEMEKGSMDSRDLGTQRMTFSFPNKLLPPQRHYLAPKVRKAEPPGNRYHHCNTGIENFDLWRSQHFRPTNQNIPNSIFLSRSSVCVGEGREENISRRPTTQTNIHKRTTVQYFPRRDEMGGDEIWQFMPKKRGAGGGEGGS